MKNIRQILNEALNDIKPDKEYEREIFKRLNLIIKKINGGRKDFHAILGGSGAKGTWLKAFDADIFVLFYYNRYKDKSSELSNILEKCLKEKFGKIIRIHGSRDYFQIKEGSFTFEIVPILKIKNSSQAKNITDVSPLHSEWVRKHRKLADEMKLTKQFCQANNLYGAESYIRGFSGYVCEILAAYYGSFLSLMKSAAKWKELEVIDVQKYYRGKDVFKMVNTSKLLSPLIVIDPVQKDRNASAALSAEKFEAFRNAAKEFLKNPSREFFVKKPMSAEFLDEMPKNSKLIIAEAKPLKGKIDIVGSKLLKIYEFLTAGLEKNGFKTIKTGWEWNKKGNAFFYFLLDKKPLPKNTEIEGPPLKFKEHAENFKKIHKKTFVKSGKIFAIKARKFTTPESLINSLIINQFITEKSNSIKTEVL